MSNKVRQQPVSVCFVSPKSYPLFNDEVTSVFGGAEVDAYLLSTELARDPYFRVSVIAADYGQADAEIREGVNIIKGLDFRRNGAVNICRLWRAMNESGADVFFLETASPGVPLAGFYCRMKGKALVYRMASRLESDGTYLRRHPVVGRAFLAALRRAGLVIAQNESDRNNMLSLAGIKSVVIANGQRIPPEAPANERSGVLWAGRSERVKRPDLLLELARRIPNEKFVMICQRATGDDKYELLRSEAMAIGNVTFIERVPFGRMDSQFQKARVLVNTSDSEGFPNAFIQACKNSTAIVSLNANPDDFLTRNQCGIFCGGDFERLVSSVQKALADGSWTEMGRNGRRYAAEHHDLARIIEIYKEQFKLLAGRGS